MCLWHPGGTARQGRSSVSFAQFVHPARDLAWQSGRAWFRPTFRWSSCNATLWRAIGTGLGFALIGLVMMVLAIGAAGVASPASGSRDDAPVAGPRAVGSHHLEAYRNPAEALTEAMPVP
jgi:hypothetical protein